MSKISNKKKYFTLGLRTNIKMITINMAFIYTEKITFILYNIELGNVIMNKMQLLDYIFLVESFLL